MEPFTVIWREKLEAESFVGKYYSRWDSRNVIFRGDFKGNVRVYYVWVYSSTDSRNHKTAQTSNFEKNNDTIILINQLATVSLFLSLFLVFCRVFISLQTLANLDQQFLFYIYKLDFDF